MQIVTFFFYFFVLVLHHSLLNTVVVVRCRFFNVLQRNILHVIVSSFLSLFSLSINVSYHKICFFYKCIHVDNLFPNCVHLFAFHFPFFYYRIICYVVALIFQSFTITFVFTFLVVLMNPTMF